MHLLICGRRLQLFQAVIHLALKRNVFRNLYEIIKVKKKKARLKNRKQLKSSSAENIDTQKQSSKTPTTIYCITTNGTVVLYLIFGDLKLKSFREKSACNKEKVDKI